MDGGGGRFVRLEAGDVEVGLAASRCRSPGQGRVVGCPGTGKPRHFVHTPHGASRVAVGGTRGRAGAASARPRRGAQRGPPGVIRATALPNMRASKATPAALGLDLAVLQFTSTQ